MTESTPIERDLLRSMLHGTLAVEEVAGGLACRRLTRGQLDLLADIPSRLVRARCPAGCRLVLRTDAAWLDLDLVLGATARDWASLDVIVDGNLHARPTVRPCPRTWGPRIRLPGAGMHVVEIWLPLQAECLIMGAAVSSGARVELVPRAATRLLCLGDSITQGMEGSGFWTAFPAQVARHLGADLLNQGIGGHTVDPHWLDDAPAWDPQVVIIAYGTNDFTRGDQPEQVGANCAGLVRAARRAWATAQVVMVSPLWRTLGPRADGVTLAAIGSAIRLHAAQEGALVIDGFQLVPNTTDCFIDGTHPNEQGFLHYSLGMISALRGLADDR